MLYLERLIADEMIANVESSSDEQCGFLFGHDSLNDRTVTKILSAKNIAADTRRLFEIAPKEYMNAENIAIKQNISLIGIYHSHPEHPAAPSETDLKAAQPYFSYIILSIKQKKVDNIRSWRLSDLGQFEEETIIHL